MNKPVSGPWWSALGMGGRDAEPEGAADTDYADMGTAFGLDASLSAQKADRDDDDGDEDDDSASS